MLDALPSEGSFTEIVQKNDCPIEAKDSRAADVYVSADGPPEESLFDRTTSAFDASDQNRLKFLMSDTETSLDLPEQQELKNPPTDQENLDETTEESMSLHDAIIRALRDHDSIPPSLMKRLEFTADKTLMQKLQDARHNPIQFQSLLLRFVGSSLDGDKEADPNEFRPPSPSTPPPKTFEDELLDCLTEELQDSEDTTTSSSLTSKGSISETLTENMKFNANEEDHNLQINDNLLPSDSEQKQETMHTPLSHSNYHQKYMRNRKNQSALHLNPEVINFIEFLEGSSNNPLFVQSLKIVLKLLTEQPEFQSVFTQKELTESLITYADS